MNSESEPDPQRAIQNKDKRREGGREADIVICPPLAVRTFPASFLRCGLRVACLGRTKSPMGLIKWHISSKIVTMRLYQLSRMKHCFIYPSLLRLQYAQLSASGIAEINHAAAGRRVRMERRSSRPNPCSARSARLGFLGSQRVQL